MANPLPKYCVDVVEAGTRGHRGWTRCEIGTNLRFDTGRLESYCLADWDVRVYDAFVVAAAVQFCDHTRRRPSTGWGRDFSLCIAVHNPDHWKSGAVSTPLHDALVLLTGDRWHIDFVRRNEPLTVCRQKHFVMPDSSGVIVPFSDGLDSYAITRLMEKTHGQSLVRVRLGTCPLSKDRTRDKYLPFASVPYQVVFDPQRPVETSSRSRAFRFVLLSGIAAFLCKVQRVVIPESGQGALGSSLVVVGQAHPDYRCHPRFTCLMEGLIAALFDHEVNFEFPRILHTKGETLREFLDSCPNDNGWAETRSCWQDARQVSVSGRRRQCGICAACLLRRMSLHSCGRFEEPGTYIWENLSASSFVEGASRTFKARRSKGALHEYAIAGALHLDHLADLLCSSARGHALDRQVFFLSRSRRFSEVRVRAKLERMLRRHREEWKLFIDSLGSQSFLARWVTGV